jgi:DNA adenine methylase
MRKIDSTAASAVIRARPLAGYVGGKRWLAPLICPRIDAHRHRCYVEPFLGMGSIFLGRARRAPIEVINDKSDQIVTLFRVVQRHPDELVRTLRHQLTSRADYKRLFRIDPATLTDVERATRFLVLRRQTFGAKEPYDCGFGTSRVSAKAFDAENVVARIEALHARLNRVVIEHLDFEALVRAYDGPQTFFYLDPPYWGATGYYREAGFTAADFPRVAAALKRLRGQWLLSLNEHPAVRKLFNFARIERVPARRGIQGGHTRTFELLISPR